jgi:hypothetical protein
LTSMKSTRRRDVISGASVSRVGIEENADERTNTGEGCVYRMQQMLLKSPLLYGGREVRFNTA